MAPSLWQILIVVVLLVLLFGRGKISALMGDVAKGIKSFKRGMAEDDTANDPARVEHTPGHGHGREGTIDVTPDVAPGANKDRA
jgi:sec-independent protein translocase protein TatA